MLVDFVNRVMLAFTAAERVAAGSAEYADAVEPKLDRLDAAVKSAIAQDYAQAASFWTELGRVMKHPFTFLSERKRFYDEADARANEARDALTEVKLLCATKVGIHAEVPAKLRSDARQWLSRRGRVDDMAQRAVRLRDVSGWTGSAHDGYVAAATVQINALQELSGVMESTAQGCEAGAMLNRAIFFVVGKATDRAANRVESAPSGGGDAGYFLRTVTARNECNALKAEIQQAINGTVAAGSANNLASQISNTIAMPNLLTPGSWPTGTSAVNTPPANTSDGVTADGNDGDLDAPTSNHKNSDDKVDL